MQRLILVETQVIAIQRYCDMACDALCLAYMKVDDGLPETIMVSEVITLNAKLQEYKVCSDPRIAQEFFEILVKMTYVIQEGLGHRFYPPGLN